MIGALKNEGYLTFAVVLILSYDAAAIFLEDGPVSIGRFLYVFCRKGLNIEQVSYPCIENVYQNKAKDGDQHRNMGQVQTAR